MLKLPLLLGALALVGFSTISAGESSADETFEKLTARFVDGMSRDEAMRWMIEGAFQEEREAAGKWVRAQLTSTQLSTYFVGYQEHADLRREYEARAGETFDLKAYHDALLSFGSPPVQFVRALMLDRPIPRGGM